MLSLSYFIVIIFPFFLIIILFSLSYFSSLFLCFSFYFFVFWLLFFLVLLFLSFFCLSFSHLISSSSFCYFDLYLRGVEWVSAMKGDLSWGWNFSILKFQQKNISSKFSQDLFRRKIFDGITYSRDLYENILQQMSKIFHCRPFLINR